MCLDLCQAWLLVDAQNVARRVAKEGIDLVLIRIDRLHDLAACGDDGLDGCRGTRDHDEHEQAWISRGRAFRYPRAAHFAGRVVESSRAVTALPDVPAEGLLVSIMVASAATTIETIIAAGGEIVQPVNPDEHEVYALFRDPAGNILGIYQQPGLAEIEAQQEARQPMK